ncbi:MAG: hypothetical protein M1840_009087 [Geoglossum simile]|nr:MAG: hypothetical protein M1840_009087 [Geoglossum simile]
MNAARSGANFGQQTYDRKSEIPFKHLDLLGQGSFGYVDKVERRSEPFQGQIYARKIIRIPLNLSRREVVKTSIQNEVNIVKGLRHTHIVRVDGTYICGTTFAIVMSPVAEEDLAEYLHRVDDTSLDSEGSALREQIRGWFGCMASAICYIHKQQICHRDIKPANFLVMNGAVLLTDFGIALEIEEETLSTTAGGPGARSPMYCAPEVAAGHRRGRLADIFSLGAVFLEMLTVYSGYGQLAKFDDLRRSDVGRSYAGNVDKVSQWVESLGGTPHEPWFSTTLFLCRSMLNVERGQRPTASALNLCWSYQPFLALSPSCGCFRLSNRPKIQSVREANGGTRRTPRGDDNLAICSLIEGGMMVDNCGALKRASGRGQKGIVDALLHRGVDINSGGALWKASAGGFEAIVRVLLENGADPEVQNENGETAMHAAIWHRKLAVLRLLLEKGATAITRSHIGLTALHAAAARGEEAIVRLLMENGVDPDTETNDGWTALHLAAVGGHSVVVRILAERGANTGAKSGSGWTALHFAANAGYEAVARFLLNKEVDIEAKSDVGWTALHYAVDSGHIVMTKLLVVKGANIEARSAAGWTTLHISASDGHYLIARHLIEQGVNIEAKSDVGQTALHCAVDSGHISTVRLLVEKGADIEAKSDVGWTALHYAANKGHAAIARLLVERGSNMEIGSDEGWGPLRTATRNGHHEVTILLLEKGAKVY